MNVRDLAKNAWALVVDAGGRYAADNASHWAAALAFYAVFSLAPLLVVAVAVAGAVFGDDAATGQVANELQAWLGPKAADYVQQMLLRAAAPGGGWVAGVVGLVTLFYGSSRVFNALRSALNVIWDAPPRSEEKGLVRGFILDYARALAMVPLAGVLFLTLIVLSVTGATFSGVVSNYLEVPRSVWRFGEFLLSWLFVATLFAAVFKLLPNVTISRREVWGGAAVTALLFGFGRIGIEVYMSWTYASTTSVFGAAGTLAALLVWFFLSAQAFFFGAELLAVWVKTYGSMAPAEGSREGAEEE
jgi:membrane protein